MGSRTWIKIYCERWLNGTIREETPEVRGIWVDLLVLAGSGKYGDSGEIKITDNVGFLDEQLADLLQISRQKWATIKKKLMQTDRVIVKNNNIIAIKKWSKYQSEYDRQKVYRQLEDTNNSTLENSNQKLQPEVTTKSTARERDKRIEKENTKENTKRKYGEFKNVLLTDEEYQKLKDKLGGAAGRFIENLSGYLESHKRKHYDSHYATILNWSRKEGKGGKARNPRDLPEIYTKSTNDDV